jgi:hypothetical protein
MSVSWFIKSNYLNFKGYIPLNSNLNPCDDKLRTIKRPSCGLSYRSIPASESEDWAGKKAHRCQNRQSVIQNSNTQTSRSWGSAIWKSLGQTQYVITGKFPNSPSAKTVAHFVCWISGHTPHAALQGHSDNCTCCSHDDLKETWNLKTDYK